MNNKSNNSKYESFDKLKAPINKTDLWEKISLHEDFPRNNERRKIFFWIFVLTGLFLITIYQYDKDWYIDKTESIEAILPYPENIQNKGHMAKSGIDPASMDTFQVAYKFKNSISNTIQNDVDLIPDVDHRVKNDISTNYARQDHLADRNYKSEFTSSNLQLSNESLISVNDKLTIQDDSLLTHNKLIKEVNIVNKLDGQPLSFLEMSNSKKVSIDELSIIHKNNSNKLTLSLSTGIGYHLTQFNAPITNNDSNINNLRKENTKAKESYITQIVLERPINQNWEVNVGMQYSRIFENYNLKHVEVEYFRNTNNDIFYSATQKTSIYHYFHKIESYDLLLKLGKNWHVGRFKYGAKAGLMYNLKLAVTGDLIDNNLKTYSIDNESWYNNRLAFSLNANLEITYSLTNSSSLFLTAQVESSKSLVKEKVQFIHNIIPFYGMVGYKHSL